MLICAGVDILTISRRLGHSKAAITLDTYGADAAAAKAIEGRSLSFRLMLFDEITERHQVQQISIVLLKETER